MRTSVRMKFLKLNEPFRPHSHARAHLSGFQESYMDSAIEFLYLHIIMLRSQVII
jgi:hypothetical protein